VIANENMARAVRAVTTERGRDPRTFSLVAFGGNGPVHAALVAAELSRAEISKPSSNFLTSRSKRGGKSLGGS